MSEPRTVALTRLMPLVANGWVLAIANARALWA
eukprot:COSAG02_NODE_28297_length_592_cov_0.841785_1_plen_33_part_10